MSRRQPSGPAASAASPGSGTRPPGPPAGGPRRGGHGAAMAPAEKSLNFGASARRLIGLLKPHRLRVIAVLALSVTAVVMNVVAPKVLGKAVDAVFAGSVSMHLPLGSTKAQAVAALRASGQSKMADMVAAMDLVPGSGIDFDRVATILLTVVALYVVASLLQVVQARLLNTVVQRTVEKLRADVDAKLQRVPLAYVDSRPRGELLSRVTNDIDNVGQSMQQSAGQLLVSICTVLGVVVMMLTVSWQLTIVALLTIPLVMLVAGQIMKRSQGQYVAQWAHTGTLNGQIEEAFTAHELVKVFGRGPQVEAAFASTNASLTEVSRRAQFLSGLMMPIMMFVGNLQYVAICVIGGVRVASGQMTLGDVTVFIQYSRQFTQPVTQIASMINLLQSGVASAERVFEVLDAPEESRDARGRGAGENAHLPTPLRGEVVFDDVRFGYHPDAPLITGLDLRIEPGQTVAIVGPTGAGKTTLVNLVMRFYDVDAGRILVDGVDVRDVPREELRSHFGMVLQDSWLFRGTIADNLRYGRLDASDDELLEAARATFVDRFVHSLPDGYDTIIDDEGGSISTGERQLITIARAFLARPDILILDEATSSVDTRTEATLQQAMAALRQDRTSFVIAHRLSTIRDADIILVMENGDIVEQGSHDDLLAARGAYWRLYEAQFAGAAQTDTDEGKAADVRPA
ncbi:multidrug ABC transporter ATP-binding protein [Dermacoccus nishinomiyaensis]|uniref:Fatty acid ABC transporter ATP-binding/permease protein n=2 Tax=Dermacoccus TaxID=57495 RepID=A0A075JJJ5_9MICO|nr:ABC transporter ATP-binding protein [Dermacoccus nishinomiyaensis]AIF41537.1 multidrug ABC transporter ATP-binding protein [Dermacoccus nishinomiyaensis]